MILLNGRELETDLHFPDGTFSFRVEPELFGCGRVHHAFIRWHYEHEEETMALWHLSHFLRSHGIERIDLEMPYIPNARLDRVQNPHDVFTLKHFADFINAMGFSTVTVFDPHSNVSTALLDRVCVTSPEPYIRRVVGDIGDPELVLFYPDEGAAKRYSGMLKRPYGFGVKRRDWETGKILDLEVITHVPIDGKNVLIIDDICSRGGTFYHSAKALEKQGAKDIYLYCSHCERTIFDGPLPSMESIKRVYTTDSIFVECARSSGGDIWSAAPSGLQDKMKVFRWEPSPKEV